MFRFVSFNIFGCMLITGIVGNIVKNGVAPHLLTRAVEKPRNGATSLQNTPGLMNADSETDSECDLFTPSRNIVHPP